MITAAFTTLGLFLSGPLWSTQLFVNPATDMTDAKRIEIVAPASPIANREAQQFLANIGRIRQHCLENNLVFVGSVHDGLKVGQNSVSGADTASLLSRKLKDRSTVNTCEFRVMENGKVVKEATFIFIYRQDETKKWRLIEIEPI